LKKRSKYTCELTKLGEEELIKLKDKCQSGIIPLWFAKFVERFYLIASKSTYSKREICEKTVNVSNLLSINYKLSQTMLSENTNIESAKFRVPNIDTLIALASVFNVSTDYLLGISDNVHPQYDEISRTTGLSDEAISSLKFKEKIRKMPTYTIYQNDSLPITPDGTIDMEKLPQVGSDGLFNQYFSKKGVTTNKEIIGLINSIIIDSPEIFTEPFQISAEESTEDMRTKIRNFNSHCPNHNYLETLNLLITYKDGYLINLLSEYLFSQDDFEITANAPLYTNPFENSAKSHTLDSNDAISFVELQTELIKLKQEKQKGDHK
jgi:transcriptional regulator with XRE-family HTH domain